MKIIPVLGDKEQGYLAREQKIDLAEVAVVDATPSDDAKRFWDWTVDNIPAGTQWASVGKRIWSAVGDRSYITDDTCVEFGEKADFLYIAGHGLTTHAAIMGSENDSDTHPLGIYQDVEYSRPNMDQSLNKAFRPSDIGSAWNNGELEWCILAVCSQVHISDSVVAGDNGVKWIKAMPKVHTLMGYHSTAPSGGADVAIAGDFVGNLDSSDHVWIAWMLANRPNDTTCPGRFATALVNMNNWGNTGDTGDIMYQPNRFPTDDSRQKRQKKD